MTSTRLHKLSLWLPPFAVGLALAAALLGPLAAAPIAHADATDDAFVAALRAHGIEHESVQAEITQRGLRTNGYGAVLPLARTAPPRRKRRERCPLIGLAP